MKTTLLITTYNRPDALEAVLTSVEHQIVKPHQVIVADDGSGQETFNIVQKFQKKWSIPLIHSWHEDNGFRLAESRNRGLSFVENEYLIMIDGDMILHPYFIQDHIYHAKKGYFLQGGRALLTEELTKKILQTPSKYNKFKYFQSGLESRFEKRLTTFRSIFLSNLWKKETQSLKAIRGCNMSFFYDDIVKVNGFDSNFVGWGREDSEFVVRLFNIGVKRYNIKYAAIAYHLYHKEESRASLPENDKILEDSIQFKKTRCENGLDKFIIKLSQ